MMRILHLLRKNAAIVVVVVKLATLHRLPALPPQVELRGGEHAQKGCRQINPEVVPNAGGEGRTERSGGIHAHPGERRFKSDISRNQRGGEKPCVAREAVVIREIEHGRHHSGRNDEFGCERYPWPARTWGCYHISHGRVRYFATEELSHQKNAQNRTRELCGYIEESIPELDFAQSKEGEGH